MPPTPEEVRRSLDVTDVQTVKSLKEKLEALPPQTIHLLPSYSLPSDTSTSINTSDKYLQMACQRARLIKTAAEIDLIQLANDISSRAHEGVMRSLGAGDMHSEYEASAVFSYYCARNKAKSMAYETIAASGTSAGTLHYIKNKDSFPSTGEGSLLLLDAGCEFNNYAADITRTFPIGRGGKFTPEAKEVYHLVAKMQDTAFLQIRPGCSWERLQRLMHWTLAAGLLKLGVLKKPEENHKQKDYGAEALQDDAREGRMRNALIEQIIGSGVTTAFFPHGLGHSLGLDVHDCPLASRPEGPSSDPLLRYLRFTGSLEEGNCITVEPGCYFNPFLLKPFKDSPYIDQEMLKKYMPVGGVRLEDE